MFKRALTPLIRFHAARWSLNPIAMNKLDRVQRAMMAKLQAIPPLPYEDVKAFVLRKSKSASKALKKEEWSKCAAEMVVGWDLHCDRHPKLWPARLRGVQDNAWLQSKRAPFVGSTLGIDAGRTATRSAAGGVPTRWQDGLAFSKRRVSLTE